MHRPDGSYNSIHNKNSSGAEFPRDFGTYKALITGISYADTDGNPTKNDPTAEVLYEVQIMGGHRDGQIFSNARVLNSFGGISNFEERTLKPVTTLSTKDFANPYFTFEVVKVLNGDQVYVQFVSGNLYSPLIIGCAKHPLGTNTGVTEAESSKYKIQFNGIYEEIDKDGQYLWKKANGKYVTVPVPNLLGKPEFLKEQFVPFPGQEEAVKITLGNQFDFLFKMNVTPGTGISVGVDGIADSLTVTSGLGSSLLIDGLNDKLVYTTLVGAGLTVDGFSDAVEVKTAVGTALTLDGLSDQVDLKTAAGAQITVSGTSGITVKNALGDSLTLTNGAVELKNLTGAMLAFDQTGFIKLGNASGDVLAILGEAFQALSTQTAAGFGAPTSTVADFVQLAIKLKLITG